MSSPSAVLAADADWHWSPTPYPGVDFTWLRRNPGGGGSALLKLEQGARLPPHRHPGWERIFITVGKLKIGEHLLENGDHLFIDRQVAHAVEALQPCIYLAITETDGVELIDAQDLRLRTA
ncbi:cupin domain-containing protein [Chromobacterium sphagni]|uniref:ChrR-like cupin domain-containing protein n=1 Tax=Chromobacterium sphagni TaxID=1903179 RepID=A0A1S1X5J2_9NEIS|nr:cupin domain-containing protein [Chromobacterium sphagni]OHX14748.1 hypothetical protein BI347_15490 [Chromobacterium sphagni]OHX16502.1 hypothetical protein BI344_21455 [Chromobacterium sphagni]